MFIWHSNFSSLLLTMIIKPVWLNEMNTTSISTVPRIIFCLELWSGFYLSLLIRSVVYLVYLITMATEPYQRCESFWSVLSYTHSTLALKQVLWTQILSLRWYICLSTIVLECNTHLCFKEMLPKLPLVWVCSGAHVESQEGDHNSYMLKDYLYSAVWSVCFGGSIFFSLGT